MFGKINFLTLFQLYDTTVGISDFHIHTEVLAHCFETALKAAANSGEFPFAFITIDFTDNDRCFNREVFSQIETDNFTTSRFINYSDVGVTNLSKILTTIIGIIDGHSHSNLLDI